MAETPSESQIRNREYTEESAKRKAVMSAASRDAAEQRKVMQEAGPYLTLGVQLALTMVVFYALGAWMDGHFKSGALWTAVLSGFGAIAGVIYFIVTVTQLSKKEDDKARADRARADRPPSE